MTPRPIRPDPQPGTGITGGTHPELTDQRRHDQTDEPGGTIAERRFAVFGNATLEINVPIGQFPVRYEPDRSPSQPITVGVSGTAYNIGTALWRLGNRVTLCVTHGEDPVGAFVTHSRPHHDRLHLMPVTVPDQRVTVVLTGQDGRRLILTDPRRSGGYRHDPSTASRLIADHDVLVLPIGPVNTAIAEHLAADPARQTGQPGPTVACERHAIAALTGAHEPFCEAADILFMSDERLPLPSADWLEQVMDRWPCHVAVIGQGAAGATLAVRGDAHLHHIPAAAAPRIASTLGAGDALFAAFLDGHTRGLPPLHALRRATVFAAAKLAHTGGAAGFLTAPELDQLTAAHPAATGPT